MNPSVLLPRQDSECLVEAALTVLKAKASAAEEKSLRRLGVLDVGVGSGCLLLSVLKEMKESSATPNGTVSGIGLDISKEAIKVCAQNAEQ